MLSSFVVLRSMVAASILAATCRVEQAALTCSFSATLAMFTYSDYSLHLTSLSTGQVTCTAQVRSMGFMHAMHEQVFGLASMVDSGQSDTTRTLTQVCDQLAHRSPASFQQVSDQIA